MHYILERLFLVLVHYFSFGQLPSFEIVFTGKPKGAHGNKSSPTHKNKRDTKLRLSENGEEFETCNSWARKMWQNCSCRTVFGQQICGRL